jgi:FkbM family methyltransferase
VTAATKQLLRRLLPRRVAPRRILAGPLRGAWIVTSWHDYPAAILGRTERPLLAWLAANVRAGETWLDVGAHYGYTAIALSRLVGASGRVFAFEPMVSTAGHLARTRRMNGLDQLVVLPLALAAPEALQLQQSGTTRGMIAPSPSDAAQEPMLVTRLDWLWPEIHGGEPQVHGLKIDVQGMELEVLEGALDLLQAHRPKLVIEVHPGVSRGRLLERLRVAGYAGPGVPIEPVTGEVGPKYVDDRSYFFAPDLPCAS